MLLDLNIENGAVRRRARKLLDIHLPEETERSDPDPGPIHKDPVEGVAFGDAHLAANDFIDRAGVAADLHPLHIDARPLVHFEHHVHHAFLRADGRARIDVHEGVAGDAGGEGDRFGRVLDALGVELLALADPHDPFERGRVQFVEGGFDLHLAEIILAPLFDGEGDEEILAVGGEFGDRGDHLKVRIPVLAVELAQEVALIFDPIGIVIVLIGEELPPAAFRGEDLALQLRVGEDLVAHEVHLEDACLGPFVDFEDHVDAVLRERTHLRRHLRAEPSRSPIDLENPAHIGLHLGARIDDPRGELDLFGELVFLELLVPLEDHPVDDGVLHDLDGHDPVVDRDCSVAEEAGPEEGLQGKIDQALIGDVACAENEIGRDGPCLDPFVSDDLNPPDELAVLGDRAAQNRGCERRRQDGDSDAQTDHRDRRSRFRRSVPSSEMLAGSVPPDDQHKCGAIVRRRPRRDL